VEIIGTVDSGQTKPTILCRHEEDLPFVAADVVVRNPLGQTQPMLVQIKMKYAAVVQQRVERVPDESRRLGINRVRVR
jgi:hypothetical protein